MQNLGAHVGVASVNQTVGDWQGNARRIREVIDEARRRDVRLLLLPEMCIPGYSLGDRLLRQGTIRRSWDVLLSLREHTAGIAVAVGLPIAYEGVLFNAMAMLADGALVGLTAKENLATGDVEYENRYFEPWPPGRVAELAVGDVTSVPLGPLLFELPGLGAVGFEICEDAWKGIRPGSIYVLGGADILLNPSASWFSIGKHRQRRRMVEQISFEDHCVYLYASLVGCDATRMVFDGSTFIASDGEIVGEGRRFVFNEEWDLLDRVVDVGQVRHARMEEGSWREQHARLQNGIYGPAPTRVLVAGDYASAALVPAPAPYWEPAPPRHPDPSLAHHEALGLQGRTIREADLNHLELELALSIALRDYQKKTGLPGFTLALSGGRDSAMVALLVRRMFRHEHPLLDDDALDALVAKQFVCAYMATENSGPETRAAARAIAQDVGARFLDGEVQESLDSAMETVTALTGVQMSWANAEHDIPLQNIQARLRGMLIWTVANLDGSLLLVTSNKSEAAVGYTTMDGDSSGGLAPLADVPKSLVSLWLEWAHRFHGYVGLGQILELSATAELRPLGSDQTDEADLMPFEVLDRLMHAFVQLGLEPVEMVQRLWLPLRHRYDGDLRRFAGDVRRFVRLFCFAQWKRERFAISFRVTSFDLDPKTGFRFPAVQAPFTEELAEMDTWVDAVLSGSEAFAEFPLGQSA